MKGIVIFEHHVNNSIKTVFISVMLFVGLSGFVALMGIKAILLKFASCPIREVNKSK